MRLKDSKLHLMLIAVVITILAIFSVFYFTSVKNELKADASKNALLSAEESLSYYNRKIDYYRYSLKKDEQLEELEDVTSFNQEYLDFFIENVYIGKESILEGTQNNNYYLYIKSDSKIVRTNLSNVLPIEETEKIDYSAFFIGSSGEVITSRTITTPIYSFLQNQGNNDLTELKASTNEKSNYSQIVTIDGTLYTLSLINMIDEVYYLEMNEAVNLITVLDKNKTLTYVFGSVITISIVAVCIVFYLAYRKQSRYRFNRGVNPPGSFIIKVDKKCNIIESNKDFKTLVDRNNFVNNIGNLITMDGKIVQECLGRVNDIILILIEKENPLYINFLIFNYGKYYYLIGKDTTEQFKKVERLENITLMNQITKLPNYSQMQTEFIEFNLGSFDKFQTYILVNMIEHAELEKLFGQYVLNDIIVETALRLRGICKQARLYHVSEHCFTIHVSNYVREDNANLMKEIMRVLRQSYTVNSNTILVKFKYATVDILPNEVKTITLEEINKRLQMTMERVEKLVNRDVLAYDINVKQYNDYRIQMQMDILVALKEGEFEMYFQPQYSLEEGYIKGFESLLRWNNPKYKSVSPQEYIELSEQCGYITQIGNYAIREVLRKTKELEAYDVVVALNVSPAQILQTGFTSFLLEEFERNELKPGSIAIEITETFLMENFNIILDKLNLLKSRGILIHLDDFGTGYSSMQYIQELPIDTIKVDRAFIKDIASSKPSKAITRTIINLAKLLNLEVIAEGVETQDQSTILKQLGATLIQGYLISRPVPFQQALKDLEKRGKKKKDVK